MQPNRDPEYVVRMLDELLRERGASREDMEVLAAYQKLFHSNEKERSPETNLFCRSQQDCDRQNMTYSNRQTIQSVRMIRNDFPELPLDVPFYTAQIISADKDRVNHLVRQDSPDGEYVPLVQDSGIICQKHIFLDNKLQNPIERQNGHPIPFSARQEAFLYCLSDHNLCHRIDWENPQICATAISIDALKKSMRGAVTKQDDDILKAWTIRDAFMPQKNDYPAMGDFRISEDGGIQSEMPLYHAFKDSEGNLSHGDHRIQFSSTLSECGLEISSLRQSEKPLEIPSPVPEEARRLLWDALKGIINSVPYRKHSLSLDTSLSSRRGMSMISMRTPA